MLCTLAVREYLKELAKTEEFLKATDNSLTRMADRECVLRFVAFYARPWEEYDVIEVNGYLCRVMENINAMTPEQRNSISKDFKKAASRQPLMARMPSVSERVGTISVARSARRYSKHGVFNWRVALQNR